MAVYTHRRLRLAYTWFGTRVPTPAWIDDNDWAIYERHPRIGRLLFWFFAWSRATGIIRMRYWGRA